MSEHDIIVIGASAGGIGVLTQFLGDLPESFPASIFVVVHLRAGFPSVLPTILSRASRIPAVHAREGAPIEKGKIYVAPPDYHLLLDNGMMHLSQGPKENRARPAIDPLFRTAAWAYGPRVIGVVLSGALYDGTAGLIAIKRCGGIAIVQDPHDAPYSSMPRSAIQRDHPDCILPAGKMAATLSHLALSDFQGGVNSAD